MTPVSGSMRNFFALPRLGVVALLLLAALLVVAALQVVGVRRRLPIQQSVYLDHVLVRSARRFDAEMAIRITADDFEALDLTVYSLVLIVDLHDAEDAGVRVLQDVWQRPYENIRRKQIHLQHLYLDARLAGLIPARRTDAPVVGHDRQLVQRPFGKPERSRERNNTGRRMHRKLFRLLQDAVVDLTVQPQVRIFGHHVQDTLVEWRILGNGHRILGRIEQWTKIVCVQHPDIDHRIRFVLDAAFALTPCTGCLHLQPVAVALLPVQHDVVRAQPDREKDKVTDQPLFRLEELVLIARHDLVLDLELGRHVDAHPVLVRWLDRVRLDDAVLRYRDVVDGVRKVKAVLWTATAVDRRRRRRSRVAFGERTL
uniref:Putative secreted protein n=1 Tax=Anopheles darlingi TaxID=43151 RepID=A0A2M4D535_ANODA